MRAHRRLLLAFAAVLVVLAATAPTAAQGDVATKCVAYTVLKPGNEVRDPGSPDPVVDSRAFGAALVFVNGTQLSFTVAIVNPARETFTLGHIHVGAAGTNGPPVVDLFTGPAVSPRLFLQADRLTITEDLAAQICGNVTGYYINYHTTLDPPGAVRGQLVSR
jgi:hypothetical protein